MKKKTTQITKNTNLSGETKIKSLFDSIRQEDEFGEFWYARDLMKSLEYTEWRNFENVIQKAKESCKNTNLSVMDCFVDINKTLNMPKGGEKIVQDIKLNRHACYLIAQNADPLKKSVALAQKYFNIQTIRQEISDTFKERIDAREHLTETENRFNDVAYKHECEGKDIADIRSQGDKELFGKRTAYLKSSLDIPPKKPLADYIDTVFIKAKDFAIAMTTYKTERDNLVGKTPILQEHLTNSREVKSTLIKQGIDPVREIKNIGKIPVIKDKKKQKIQSSQKKLEENIIEINISKDLWKYALYLIYKNNGALNTTQIREEIIKLGIIPQQYLEENPKKKEPYIYQIIRNLKSNAKNKISWVNQGYVEIVDKGFQITQKGIDFVKIEFVDFL